MRNVYIYYIILIVYNENGIAYLAQVLSKYFNVSKDCITKTEMYYYYYYYI